MKKVFLDTNFILDLLARDQNYRSMAKEVLELALENDMEFYISFLSVANFAYIMRKEQPDILRLNIRLLCSLFKVVANVETHLLSAISIDTKDYEDAVQYETAISAGAECIITRNKKDFKFSKIPLYSPSEFISAFQ